MKAIKILNTVCEGDAGRGRSVQLKAVHVRVESADRGGCADGGVALMAGGLLGDAHLARATVLLGDG